jgi:16S rRNA (uracil1498-N3)-methyltransferase
MRVTRVFVEEPLATGREQQLGTAAAAHVSRVLRLRTGDELTLFDGRGGEYAATIIAASRTAVRVRVREHRPIERESPLRITLVQGISRGERMDWVIQKATELGVAAIVPAVTEHSVVKLNASQARKKHEHWYAIAVSACEQSGRNRLPELSFPRALRQWLAEAPRNGSRVLLDPSAERGLATIGRVAALTLLIGPEGGLAAGERELAVKQGFLSMRVGPRVLRTETAAIAAISALQAMFGDAA